MSMPKPPYSQLYFGKSDSKNEWNEDREAFLNSYVDLNDISIEVLKGSKFLVMGPKGTGESALAWYLKAAERDQKHLTLVRDAANLPLAEIPRLQTGQEPGPERTVVAWKFILLCNYLELLLQDQGCSLNRDPECLRVAKILRQFGFMGDASGRALLRASSTTITIPLPTIGPLYRRESRGSLNIFHLIPYLERWVTRARSEIRHILVLDGLDSIFLNDVRYDDSLASLIQAAYALNQSLLELSACGSIILLIRNDIFSRVALSLPDSQKMRDDLSLDLDWRILSGSAGAHAPLFQLVNTKAGKALGGAAVDVLSYFPESITVGSSSGQGKSIPTLRYLLNVTRHTPRDLLRVFEEIRRVEASGAYESSQPELSQQVVREGVLQYSVKYFVGAISNEFAGDKLGPASAAAALRALKSLDSQTFDRARFVRALDATEADKIVPVDDLLKLLFYAGAIGNYVGGLNDRYLQFYHRREDSEIYLKGNFILHEALIYAWGLRRHPPAEDHGETAGEASAGDVRGHEVGSRVETQPRRPRRRTRGGS